MQDTISTISPTINKPAKSNKKMFAIIGVVIVAAVLGAFFFLRKPQKNENTKVVVTKTEEPTPTEKPQIDKKSVKIQVQNGTGTPGQAGTAVEALTEAGYSADNIKATNADEFSTAGTTISMKVGFEDVADDMKSVLKSKFDDVTIKSATLEKDNEFDIVIVTGGKKFEEATPTKTAVTPTASTTTPTPSTSTTLTPSPTTSPTPTP